MVAAIAKPIVQTIRQARKSASRLQRVPLVREADEGLNKAPDGIEEHPSIASADDNLGGFPNVAHHTTSKAVTTVATSALVYDADRIDQRNVKTLAESFEVAGQAAPILVVRSGQWLNVVSGAHRAAAAKHLEWEKIEAVVLDMDKRAQELLQIADNIHRRNLPVLERAEKINRWIELTCEKVAQVAQPSGGQQPKEKGISKAARILGVTRHEASRSAKIASISSAAKTKAIDLGFADNQSVLLRVAGVAEQDAQVALLMELSARKSHPPKAVATKGAVGRQPECGNGPDRNSLPNNPAKPVDGVERPKEEASALIESYPALPPFLDRRSLDQELEKIRVEWSRLRALIDCAPVEVRRKFIIEDKPVDVLLELAAAFDQPRREV